MFSRTSLSWPLLVWMQSKRLLSSPAPLLMQALVRELALALVLELVLELVQKLVREL